MLLSSKRDKLLTINPKIIITITLSGGSQAEVRTYCVIPFIKNSKKG